MPDATPLRRLAEGLPWGLVRFLGVGVVGLATNLGLLWMLERAGLTFGWALAPALLTATLVTWILNRLHTFGASGRSARQEALRYFSVALVAQGVSFVTAMALAEVLPHVAHTVDAFVGAVIATLFSYTGQRFFTFAPDPRSPAPAPAAD